MIKCFFIFFVIIFTINCKQRDLEELFKIMDIEDKCGQMTQITLDVIKKEVAFEKRATEFPINIDMLIKYIKDIKVGSILNTFGATAVVSRNLFTKLIQ